MHKKVFILIVIDQITKLIFSGRDFFLGPIHIHSIKNYALAFSLNFGMLPNLILIIGALVFFLYYYFKNHSHFNLLSKTMFALIFAGAIANLADRLYLGYVRDFIDLGLGFTFNLADAFLAAGLIGFLLMYRDKKDYFQNDF
jgi:signal peptidase II